jgi:hypothetical protein
MELKRLDNNALETVEVEQLCSRIVNYDGEPRIRDLDLAERLGTPKPLRIRELIKSNLDKLQAHGVLRLERKTSGVQGGRPTEEYWLNEEQVYRVCMWSEAPKADHVQYLMAKVFRAYQHKTDLVEKRGLKIIIRQELEPIHERLVKLEDGQEKIITEVTAIRKEQDDYHQSQRRDFTEEVRKAFAIVTRKEFGGLCCWCKNPAIVLVNEAYEFTEDAEIDHYYRRDQRRFEDGYVLCLGCHAKKDRDRQGGRVAFDYFQQVGAKYKPKSKPTRSNQESIYQKKLPIKFFK